MKKTKLFMSLITCCFALSVLAFGVYAMILNVQFTLSGKIQFEVDNIAQVKTLQVFVKDEDGTVFKEYPETEINKNGSDMGKSKIDQSIGNVESYTNQTVEIHIKVQSLTEKYVKIYLTHNEIADNADYTKEGVKVRTNSVILAPQSEDGTEKEFIIYVQYIDLGNTIQEYTLDNNFVVHFEELNDILQEDKENGYWYVEMGTIPTTTGSEYIRWRYFTSYIDPETDGSVNPKSQYTYEQGVRPTPNENGTGCFILETDTTKVIRWDGEKLNQCNFCNEYKRENVSSSYYKTGDYNNVAPNDYSTSQIRDYINGYDVYKVSKNIVDYNGYDSEYTYDDTKDKSNMLKDFCIDNNDSIFSSNKIVTRNIEELYAKNKIAEYEKYMQYATYSFSKQDFPKTKSGSIAYKHDNDKFWLLSLWEAYNILGSQKPMASDIDEKLRWAESTNVKYWLRTPYSDNATGNFVERGGSLNISEDISRNGYMYARPAFKLKF